MTLDILCKVVDNYGDIGFVYRLAKAVSDIDPAIRLRLHVDDLETFRALCPEIDPGRQVQELRAWTIIDWKITITDLQKACADAGEPRIVVECFACGRPEALEGLLFDPGRSDKRLVINLEHLTAEPWAEELHRMPSATRNALVGKSIFMPGFSAATGGLVIDRRFREAAALWKSPRTGSTRLATVPATTSAVPTTTVAVPTTTVAVPTTTGLPSARPRQGIGPESGPAPTSFETLIPEGLQALRRELCVRSGLCLAAGEEGRPWLLVFSYEHDYRRIVSALGAASRRGPSHGVAAESQSPLALVASGRGAAPFLEAWHAAGEPFPAIPLPFLRQEAWDEFILASDFAIVRGEESLARAALAGIPFIWQAYRQEGNYQLVKVQAFLDGLRPALARAGVPMEAIASYEALSLAFNGDRADGGLADAEDIGPLLEALPALRRGFEAFAATLFANGDLAARLLAYIRELWLP